MSHRACPCRKNALVAEQGMMHVGRNAGGYEPMPDLEALRRRADEVKKSIWNDASGGRVAQNIQGGVLTTISILSAIYGPASTQLERLFQHST